ncbi:MAG: NAD(P)H-quinone oxidoreductase [Candidatus Krumholzibacteria bacterium]|nr:NAD(P)H-quinone oxidoreductase [Candidatus Krumholzibacteria bacterium]
MRCAFVQIYGEDIDNLSVEERSDLVAEGEAVRVRVIATALNRADLLQRRGLYPPPAGVPDHTKDIPGLEFVGNIDQLGEGVSRWAGGERVFGIVPGGAYADQVVTHQDLVATVPDNLSDDEAAAIPEAFMTSFDALVLQGEMTAGERVLIHAVASGVGTAAVQLVSAWQAQAIGTAGSRYKLDKVSKIAPLFAVNYRETDFKEAVEYEFGDHAVDVILDVVGAEYWERNIALLNTRGRLVLVGRLSGSQAKTPLGSIMSKRLRIMGTVMRARTLAEKVTVLAAFEQQVIPLLREGKLKAVVDSVFRFEDLHRATAKMENNENVGKIVVKFD